MNMTILLALTIAGAIVFVLKTVVKHVLVRKARNRDTPPVTMGL